MKTIQPSTAALLRRKSARILAGSIAALVTAGSLATPRAQAASQIWDGGSGVNGNWSTLLNWVGDAAAPGATSGTTNTDIAIFNAAIANTWGNAVGNPIVIDSATQNLGGISFGAAAGNYFIGSTGGNSLLLSSGGTIQILGSLTTTNAIETVNAPLVIQGVGGTYTFANKSSNGSGAGAGTLNFGGGITGGAAGATVLNLSGANTNANTISGIIADGSATSLAVTKSGTGTWKLTGANTYTGTTTINAGTLTLNRQTGSLNSASALTFTGSGTFNMDNVGASGALTQSLGALTFGGGDGTVKTTRTAAFDQAITFASLAARTAGASANFVNTGTNSATNGFVFTAAPTASQIIDRGFFNNGSSYAAYAAGGFVRGLIYGTDTNTNASLTGVQANLGAISATTDAQYVGLANATTTSGVASANNTITLLVSDGTKFLAGQAITGTNVTANTWITAISGNTLTLSRSTTGVVAAATVLTPYNSVSGQTTGSVNTVNLSGVGASLTLAGGHTLSVNGILRSGGTSGVVAAISGGTAIQPGSAGGELVIRTDTVNDTLNISTIIQNNTSASTLTKTGAGTLILEDSAANAPNTYSGGTFLNAGTVQLGSITPAIKQVAIRRRIAQTGFQSKNQHV